MSYVKLQLKTIEEIQELVKIISKYDYPIEAWNEGENTVYSASSIISIFALDFSKKVCIIIKCRDEAIRSRFYTEVNKLKESEV